MTGATLVPIAITALAIGWAGLFMYFVVRSQWQERELLSAERRAAIERGQSLPPEAFLDDETKETLTRKPGNSLKTGLITLFLGIGTVVALSIAAPRRSWGWGLILVLLGVGHLSYWFAGGRAEWEQAQALELEAKRARIRSSSASFTQGDRASEQT
jgi:hypothetical protein